MIKRREFLRLAGIGVAVAVTTPVAFRSNVRNFPDDATADEINEFLYFRGLRPCPHSHHSSDEEFAECRDAKFLAAIRERLRARVEQGYDIQGLTVTDVPEGFSGRVGLVWYRFVRLHVQNQSDLTFYLPYTVLSAEETKPEYWRRPWGWWSAMRCEAGHKRELLGTPGARKMRCLVCEVDANEMQAD